MRLFLTIGVLSMWAHLEFMCKVTNWTMHSQTVMNVAKDRTVCPAALYFIHYTGNMVGHGKKKLEVCSIF